MDERVFDVSKPHKVNPGATSKPVIVGHHPEIPDPMIRENAPDKPQIPEPPEFGPPSEGNPLGLPEVPALPPEPEAPSTLTPTEDSEEKPGLPPLLAPEDLAAEKPAPASSDQPPPTAQMFNKATGQTVEPTHASWKPEHELPIAGHHHKGGFKKTPLIIVGVILGFLGLYALLDSGLVVKVDLPLHIFNPDEESTQTQQPAVVVPTQTNQTDTIAEGWQKLTNKNYGFSLPKEYEAQIVQGEYPIEGETLANTDAVLISSAGGNELGIFNVEYSPDYSEPLVTGTAEEIAKKSRETNRTDTSSTYKVEVGELNTLATKKGQLFCFKTHKGFATDYNVPSNGSGMVFGNAEYIRACFGQTKTNSVIRFMIDDKDETMERVLKSIELT